MMTKQPPQAICPIEEKARTIIATAEEFQRQLRQFSFSTRQCQTCISVDGCQVIINFQTQLREALASVLSEWDMSE